MLKSKNIFFLCYLLPLLASGQFKNYNTENEKWFDGEILTLDGQKLNGQLNYNFVNELLRKRSDNGSEIFTPDAVIYFELIISDNDKLVYYSIPYIQGYSDRASPTFFRVIYQGNNYVILSKHKFEYTENNIPDPQFSNMVNYNVEKVDETIYIADGAGVILPYLTKKKRKITNWVHLLYVRNNHQLEYNEEKLSKSATKDSNKRFKFENSKALKIILNQQEYNEVDNYVKANSLKLNDLRDLIMVFKKLNL